MVAHGRGAGRETGAGDAPHLTVLVTGASGLVGSLLVARLRRDPAILKIHAPVRRSLPGGGDGVLFDHVTTDLLGWLNGWRGACDAAVCCLGTTRRKAGSRPAFRRVDRDMAAATARAGRRGGAGQVLLVSAAGARVRAPDLYSRTKGEAEAQVRAADLPAVDIFRPGLLRGERGEPRPGETLALWLSELGAPLFRGPLRGLAAIEAETVAAAMHARLHAHTQGLAIHDNAAITALAARAPEVG